MKKVVSIALFGDSSKKDGSGQNYHVYLPTFVLAHHNLFPRHEGWELHLHIDGLTRDGRHGLLISRMAERGLVDVKVMGDAILTRAMLWRMAPIYTTDVDYVFCRDIDSLPAPRDRRCCDVFIASNCTVHTIHDSASHAGIMGGLCGFNALTFKNTTRIHSLQALYDFANTSDDVWAQHGTDQNVLNRLIDRTDGPALLEHRYNGWHAGPGKKQPRSAGSYRCASWSTPTPDVGRVPGVNVVVSQKADLLANHLGSAGYDIERARAFWEEHWSQELMNTVRACES